MTTFEQTLPLQADVRPPGRVRAATVEPRAAFRAVAVFLFVLVVAPQTWIPALGPLRIALLAAGLGALLLVWGRFSRGVAIFPLTREMQAAAALVGWAVLTIPVSFWPGGSINTLLELYIKALIAFWLIGSVVTTTRRLATTMGVLLACAVPVALTAVQNYLSGVYMDASVAALGRIDGYESGLAKNPNDLALLLNIIVPFGVALSLGASRTRNRLLAAGATALCVGGVLVTFSRAGFLTLATIIVLHAWRYLRRPGAVRMKVAAGLFAAAMATPFVLPEGYIARQTTITDIESDQTQSAQLRWEDNKAAARFMVSHPVSGAGLGQDAIALNMVRGERWTMVHNVYLQYGVDLGFPGLALFLVLFWRVVAAARTARRTAGPGAEGRLLKRLSEAVEISLLAFAVAAFFHPMAYHFPFYLLAGLAVGARLAARTRYVAFSHR